MHKTKKAEKPTCATCRHWCHEGDDVAPVGECRRHAPALTVGQVLHSGTNAAAAVWPATEEADWCGEYEAQE